VKRCPSGTSAPGLFCPAPKLNLPSLNFIAALLLAELHGRMGYFPPILRLRPAEGSVPPRYAVAEILNLQALRDAARLKREPRGSAAGSKT